MNTNLLFARRIQQFDYDEEHSVLTILFTSGFKKRYFNVPKTIVASLERSMNKDDFYQAEIDGAFCVE